MITPALWPAPWLRLPQPCLCTRLPWHYITWRLVSCLATTLFLRRWPTVAWESWGDMMDEICLSGYLFFVSVPVSLPPRLVRADLLPPAFSWHWQYAVCWGMFFRVKRSRVPGYHAGRGDTPVRVQDINKRGLGDFRCPLLFLLWPFFCSFRHLSSISAPQSGP